MADSPQRTFTPTPKRSDLDLEKGAYEPNSDYDTATIGPESEPATRDGPAGEKREEEVKEERDPNIVSWDGPDDPTNPMNWTMRKKWSNIAVLSVLTIITRVPRSPCCSIVSF
jgi:hypothetical protein